MECKNAEGLACHKTLHMMGGLVPSNLKRSSLHVHPSTGRQSMVVKGACPLQEMMMTLDVCKKDFETLSRRIEVEQGYYGSQNK